MKDVINFLFAFVLVFCMLGFFEGGIDFVTTLNIVGFFVFVLFVRYGYVFFIKASYLMPNLCSLFIIIVSFVFKLYVLSALGVFFLVFLYLIDRPYPYVNGKKITRGNTPYFRDIPCNGDIFYANTLIRLNKFNYNVSNIIGALFLKWEKEGQIVIKFDKENRVFFELKKNIRTKEFVERSFYYMVYEASKNGVLEKNELKKWIRKNKRRCVSLFNQMEAEGKERLINKKHLFEPINKNFFTHYVMDDILYEDSKKLYGLKLFLDDFSSIAERESIEVNLWQDYLMFAYILGNAKKVSKQIKKVYPDIEKLMNDNNVDIDLFF